MYLADIKTLGLSPGASKADIKRAYRKLAQEHHPDLAGADHKERFQEIHAAYSRLSPKPKPKREPDPPAARTAADKSAGRATAEAFFRDLGSTVASKGAAHARAAVEEHVQSKGKFAQAAGAFFGAALEEGEELLHEALRKPRR